MGCAGQVSPHRSDLILQMLGRLGTNEICSEIAACMKHWSPDFFDVEKVL